MPAAPQPSDRPKAPFTFRSGGKETGRLVSCAGSTDLLLLFSTVNKTAGNYWLYKQTEDLPINRLYLLDMGRSWYSAGIPGLGTDLDTSCATIQRVIKRRGFTRVFCVGQSMGGYGALLYGARLAADGILAFSTEAELMLPGSRSARHAKQVEPVAEYARLSGILAGYHGMATLVYGQFDIIDLVGAAALAALMPGLQLQEMPACTHNTPAFLLHRQLLRPALDHLIAGCAVDIPCASSLPNARDPAIRQLGNRFQEAIGAKDFAGALAQLDAAPLAATASAAARDWHAYWRATCLWRLKRFAEALKCLAPLLADHPASAALLGLHGKIACRLGLKKQAILSLEQALDLDRTLIGEAIDLAQLYLSAGRRDDARKCLATALRADPGNSTLRTLWKEVTPTTATPGPARSTPGTVPPDAPPV